MVEAFIGVDVGTRSARAGVFDARGELLASARRPIQIWRGAGEIVEQSSEDIWRAVCEASREAVKGSGLSPDAIRGLSFDATCSLVVLDAAAQPLSVSPSGEPERNIIVWMDHRAAAETRAINAGHHAVLRYVGGKLSPEMQTPKLLWLKRHLPDTFRAAAHFFDLTDFLAFRATGALDRSICTVTCKTTYLAHEKRWDEAYFRAIGLGELAEDGFRRIGATVSAPGAALGGGLLKDAAAQMGLLAGTAVGVGLIDAHAGAFATIGAASQSVNDDPKRRMALILGTSSCCMAIAEQPRFVEGVWGPYYSALTPGDWLAEGGQSAFGAAIDRLMRLHPAFAGLEADAAEGALERVEAEVAARAQSLSGAALLGERLHILPDFIGNRSPFADPSARAAVVGLDLREDRESLGELYVAGLVGLADGIGQIIESLEANGYDFDKIVVSGGAARSPLVRQIIADATGKIVCAPETAEPVLLGSAMLGAVAAGRQNIGGVMSAMSRLGEAITPANGEIAAFHARKRRAFDKLHKFERELRALSDEGQERSTAKWPALVIFDCDGVLVDSETIALDLTQKSLAKLGLDLTLEEIRRRYLGQRFDVYQRDVEALTGHPLPPAYRESETRAILAALRRGLKAIDGVEDAVIRLNVPVCVASSSSVERVALSLRLTRLDALFLPHVYSAEGVAHGKPAPDIFLHAAREMGVAPRGLHRHRGQRRRRDGGARGRHGGVRLRRRLAFCRELAARSLARRGRVLGLRRHGGLAWHGRSLEKTAGGSEEKRQWRVGSIPTA